MLDAPLPARGERRSGPLTILVVDDDRELTGLIDDALTEEGYRVVAAADVDSLRVARDQQPDLILLDLVMPGVDGVVIGQRLRADRATASIPIVAMSAVERLPEMASAMRASACLPKPFEIAQLRDVVAQWVRTSRGGERT